MLVEAAPATLPLRPWSASAGCLLAQAVGRASFYFNQVQGRTI